MKALVTGGTGFVGSHLIDRLVEDGHEVTALVRSRSRASDIADLGVKLVEGDLSNPVALKQASQNQETVFHAAGLTGAVDEIEFMAANRDGTANLVDSAGSAGVSRFVLISSGAAGGPARRGQPLVPRNSTPPVTMYGRSKLASESEVKNSGLTWTIIRPPTVYGPRDTTNFLPIFRAVKRFGVAPVFGDGSQELSLIHVSDLVSACLLAATKEETIGKTYYVNHPEVVTSRALVSAIGRQVDNDPMIFRLPKWATRSALIVTGSWASLFKLRTILRPDKINEFYQEAWTGNPTEFIEDTGWLPKYDMVSGLAQTAAWYHHQGML